MKVSNCSVLVILIYVILYAAGSKLKRPRGVSIASRFYINCAIWGKWLSLKYIGPLGAVPDLRISDYRPTSTLVGVPCAEL